MFLPQYAVGLHPDPGQLTRRRWGQSWEAFCRCHTTPVDCLHHSLFHPDRPRSPGRHCTPETGWYTDLRGPIRLCTSNCSIKRTQVLQALLRLIKLSIIFIICVWIITCIWNYSLKYLLKKHTNGFSCAVTSSFDTYRRCSETCRHILPLEGIFSVLCMAVFLWLLLNRARPQTVQIPPRGECAPTSHQRNEMQWAQCYLSALLGHRKALSLGLLV